ncbi:hypothetical protein ACHAW6_011201 [Cyclotella cf. meneghiniana]
MTSAAVATTSLPAMLSLLSNRVLSYSAPTKRSLSLLSRRPHDASPSLLARPPPSPPPSRPLSKYVAVNHAASYQKSINSEHGTQLRLALEEGRNKDDAPFDPFSQFLDQMGHGSDDDDDDDDDIEHAELLNEHDSLPSPEYTPAGSLRRPLSQRLALRAGYPSGGKFAVVALAGFQHKVTADDLIVVNKLKPVAKWSVGSRHTLREEEVLLVADAERTCVGLPGVTGAEVDVMVEEITRDKTVIVFKKRRRKNSRRKNGHRRQVTFLRVLDVRFPGEEGVVAEGEEERVAA